MDDVRDSLQESILRTLDALGMLDVNQPNAAIPSMPDHAEVIPLDELRALLTLYTQWAEYYVASHMAQESALAQAKITYRQAVADAKIRYQKISPKDIRDAHIDLDEAVSAAMEELEATTVLNKSMREMRVRMGEGRDRKSVV